MSDFLATLRLFSDQLQQGTVPPLGLWSYFLLMILIVIQGPISTLLGGVASAAGLLNPFGVLLVAMIGNLGADTFWYAIGWRGSGLTVGPLSKQRRRIVTRLENEMRQHAVRLLLLAKISIGMAVPALIAAGLARVRFRTWFPVVFAGEMIWSGGLLLVGHYATHTILAAESTLIRGGIAVTVLLILVALFLVLRAVGQHNTALKAEAMAKNGAGSEV